MKIQREQLGGCPGVFRTFLMFVVLFVVLFCSRVVLAHCAGCAEYNHRICVGNGKSLSIPCRTLGVGSPPTVCPLAGEPQDDADCGALSAGSLVYRPLTYDACNCGDFQGGESLSPTNLGSELCGDGVDNNNDGAIDEGCGNHQACSKVGRPVNLLTGAVDITHTDFIVQTGGIPFIFQRTYNSNIAIENSQSVDVVGVGWRHSYQITLQEGKRKTDASAHEEDYVAIQMAGHQSISFKKVSAQYKPDKGSGGFALKKLSDAWELSFPDGRNMKFSSDGLLKEIADTQGNRLLFSYVYQVMKNTHPYRTGSVSTPIVQMRLRRRQAYLQEIISVLSDSSLSSKSLFFVYESLTTTQTVNNPNNQIQIVENSNIYIRPLRKILLITKNSNQMQCGAGTVTAYPLINQSIDINESQITNREDMQNPVCGKPLYEGVTEPIETKHRRLSMNRCPFLSTYYKPSFFPGTAYRYDTPHGGTSGSGGGGQLAVGPLLGCGATEEEYVAQQAALKRVYLSFDAQTGNRIPEKDVLFFHYGTSFDAHRIVAVQKGSETGTKIILEQHTYDENGRSTTSHADNGKFSIDYSIEQANPNSQKRVKVSYDGVLNSERYVTFDLSSSQIVSQSGACGCTSSDQQHWFSDPASNPPNGLLENGYLLPKAFSRKREDQNGQVYTSLFYEINQTTGFITKKVVVLGDDDSNALTVPMTGDALKLEATFHPDYSSLPTSFSTDSVQASQKTTILYDYDAPTNQTCVGVQCTLSQINHSPTSLLHRILHLGWTRDIQGQWNQIVRTTLFTYDSYKRLQKTTNLETGEEVSYEYYGNTAPPYDRQMLWKRHLKVVKPDSSTVILTTEYKQYDMRGQPSEIVDPNGVSGFLSYDALGRVVEIKRNLKFPNTSDTWAFSKFLYNEKGQLAQIFLPTSDGSTTGPRFLYAYDSYGRRSFVSFQKDDQSAPEQLTFSAYDAMGNVAFLSNLRVYDGKPNGRPFPATTAQTTQFEWSFVDAGAEKVRQLRVYPPSPATEHITYLYNTSDLLHKITDQNQRDTLFSYHPTRFWQTEVTRYKGANNTLPITTKTKYDKFGNVIEREDGKGVKTQYAYDDFGQVIEMISPDRAPSNKPKKFAYDAWGRLSKVRTPTDIEISYLYDSAGRITQIAHQDTQTPARAWLVKPNITYTYDDITENPFAKGRLSSVAQTIWGGTSFFVNDAITRITKYKYDAAGRIYQELIEDRGPLVGSVQVLYGTYSTSYRYDVQGNLTELIYPVSGQHWGFVRNELGQIEKIVDRTNNLTPMTSLPPKVTALYKGIGGPLYQLAYYPFAGQAYNPPAHTTITTGFFQDPYRWTDATNNYRSYASAEPSSDSLFTGGTASSYVGLQHREYFHDNTGRLKEAGCSSNAALCFFTNQKERYQYDPLSRLSEGGQEVLHNAVLRPRFQYAYDDNNNLTQRTDYGASTPQVDQFAYAAGSNQLISLQKAGLSSRVLSYDAEGRRIQGAYRQLSYHMNSRLGNVKGLPNQPYSTGDVSFSYDHLHRKIFTFTEGATTLSFYDLAGHLLESYRYESPSTFSSGVHEKTETKTYVWMDGLLVRGSYASYNQSQSPYTQQQILNFIPDHQGKPSAVVDDTGAALWKGEYTPYGKVKEATLEQNAYEESTLSSPIDIHLTSATSASTYREILKSGTFAVQLFFEKSKLDFSTMWLATDDYSGQGWASGAFHLMTGKHHTGLEGNPTTSGFWGPILPLKGIKAHGRLYVAIQRHSGYDAEVKITKARLWRVSEGRPRAQTVSDSPVVAPDFSYLNNMSWLRTYTHEGAALIRVCFDGFQVEPYYDYVEIRDASERIVQVLTGYLGESASFCSAWVEGATVKVRFFTDSSLVSRGFRIYRVESRRAHPVDVRFPGQWLERETLVKDATTQTTVYAGLHANWHRFYDPETARYITPDPLGLMAGMNPFAYVGGDPVTFVDLEGTHPVLANLLRRFGPPLLNVLKTFGKRAHRWTKGLARGKVTSNASVPSACDKVKAAVSRYNNNDIHHLFGRGGEAPTQLLEKYGSAQNALTELQKAAQTLVNQNYVSGTWVTVKVGEMPVSITGNVIDGIFRISSIAKKGF